MLDLVAIALGVPAAFTAYGAIFDHIADSRHLWAVFCFCFGVFAALLSIGIVLSAPA